jgi:hypothetical protein
VTSETLFTLITNPMGITSWRWGYWHPAAHLLFEGLGYATSALLYYRQTVPDVLTPSVRKQVKWWTLGGAILGAKLVPVLEQITLPLWWVALLSGKSLAGGLAGGIVGTEWIKRRLGIMGSTGDVLVWPLVWGTIVGRLGCASCAVVDGMLGTAYPAQSTVSVWPSLLRSFVAISTQTNHTLPTKLATLLGLNTGWRWNMGLLELLGVLTLAGLLGVWHRRLIVRWEWVPPGALFYGFCLGYFALRIGLEALKHGGHLLTVVQGVSLLGMAWSMIQLWQINKRLAH